MSLGGSYPKPRVLLLLPTASYRAVDFLEAAGKLGAELTIASEKRNLLSVQNLAGYLTLNFKNLERSVTKVLKFAEKYPINAAVGVDDATVVAAACLAEQLSLRGNPLKAVEASRNKFKMRECLKDAGLLVPDYYLSRIEKKPESTASKVAYPCVLKPTTLAASQGVIRVNNVDEFLSAWERVRKIIRAQKAAPEVLVEAYLPGTEVAVEGLVNEGQLRVLTIFDKPDPLEGPFFEETIYVRPSRLPPDVQEKIARQCQQAIQALWLVTGPVHIELRISEKGIWVIELAARPIGGRCSRSLRFGLNVSLEELILRQALGHNIDSVQPDPTPSGVMMIPIPRAGTLKKISGLEEAQNVPGIEEIIMNAHPGQRLVPLPEGSAYLGFIFSRARTTEEVEKSLRKAHRHLKFEMQP